MPIKPTNRKWYSFGLESCETDAAVRAIRETPIFAFSDPCDCVPLSACWNFIRAQHPQFLATDNAYAVLLNLLSYDFDLRFQRQAVVPHIFDERVQTLKIIYSGNKAIISSSKIYLRRKANRKFEAAFGQFEFLTSGLVKVRGEK